MSWSWDPSPTRKRPVDAASRVRRADAADPAALAVLLGCSRCLNGEKEQMARRIASVTALIMFTIAASLPDVPL